MGTPARKLILNNLQTTFETVTTGNGYKTTVDTVQALARGYFDVKTGERNNLIDDLIAVLNVDTTRGSNAISTTVTQFETDEGDPDAHGDGSVLMQVQIRYIRNTSKS